MQWQEGFADVVGRVEKMRGQQSEAERQVEGLLSGSFAKSL
jgi:hypothetical protein